jgi:hypothetical protein
LRATKKILWNTSILSSSFFTEVSFVSRRKGGWEKKAHLVDGKHVLSLLEGAIPPAVLGVDLLVGPM